MENPYCPHRFNDDCTFVGRADAYNRIHQYLTDPTSPHALVFLGGQSIGKSALLWHVDHSLNENTFGVFVPLRQDAPTTETDVLKAIVQHTLMTFSDQHIVFRASATGETGKIDREWFAEQFLPRVFETIRAKRRLLLLLDDVDVLIDRLQSGQIPADFPAFLSGLLSDNAQLGIVLTLADERDANLPTLAPLADQNVSMVYRLQGLAQQDTTRLMNSTGVFSVSDEAVQFIQRATGGKPILLQWFGYTLYEAVVAKGTIHQTLSAEDVRALIPIILDRTAPLFYDQWQRLNLPERLVLTSMSHHLFQKPHAAITAAQIERWLIETDYPLDETAVKAALRGLEYHQFVYNDGHVFRITSSLMQTWLVHHAQLDAAVADLPMRRRMGYFFAVLIILLLTLAVVVWVARHPTEQPAQPNAAPTVTLEMPSG